MRRSQESNVEEINSGERKRERTKKMDKKPRCNKRAVLKAAERKEKDESTIDDSTSMMEENESRHAPAFSLQT